MYYKYVYNTLVYCILSKDAPYSLYYSLNACIYLKCKFYIHDTLVPSNSYTFIVFSLN